MAGGPIFPSSQFPVTAGRTFPSFHVGASSTGVKYTEGLGWEQSVGADSTWAIQFRLPPTIPTGTLKAVGKLLANATSGAAKLNFKWALCADGAAPDVTALNAEGVQTYTWAAGENDDFKLYTITLDAVSVTSSDVNKALIANLVGETSGWTLAQILTLAHLALIWE